MIAIYTALFGPYDQVLEPYYQQHYDRVSFILFTDQQVKLGGWQVKQVDRPHPDPRYASRYFFDQSSLVLPEYDYTIMHGANARLTMPPAKIIEYLPDDVDIACFAHPHRETVDEEAAACIKWNKDHRAIIEAQMWRYKDDSFPKDFRLSACILLVRRNTERLRRFENLWWNEVRDGSCRDQLSFDYCRWKTGIEIAYLPGNPFQSGILKVGKHVHSA